MSSTTAEEAARQAYDERGLRLPSGISKIVQTDVSDRLTSLLLAPDSIAAAEQTIDSSSWPILPNLVPLFALDESSYACVVASDVDGDRLPGEGAVVRWHLSVAREDQQAALLDTDCFEFAESIAVEMAARSEGLRRVLDEIGPAFEETYLKRDERPRPFVVRPLRIACQNVLVALAVIAQESSFDGLAVVAWQTCEVPHVAAHEANRALAVLTLCDAFQNGGTMEIRFDKPAWVRVNGRDQRYDGHPEACVPASLRRFGRTVGVDLGKSDKAAITPIEARALFEAVTPMPDQLRERARLASQQQGVTPERLSFTLLKPVWREIELDFLLATSGRIGSILAGGAPFAERVARQAESEVCRAAVMVGMLHRRLDGTDAAGVDGKARILEDRRRGVAWSVNETEGAVQFSDLGELNGLLPWTARQVSADLATLTVYPRALVTSNTVEQVVAASATDTVALVVPADTELPRMPESLVVLRCPDRLPDIDRTVEGKLLGSRISRA